MNARGLVRNLRLMSIFNSSILGGNNINSRRQAMANITTTNGTPNSIQEPKEMVLSPRYLQRNRIGGSTDRCADAAEVCCYRDAQHKSLSTRITFRHRCKDRCKYRQHHHGGCCIAHKHAENCGNDHQPQHHVTGFSTEWLKQHSRKVYVQLIFGGGNANENPPKNRMTIGELSAARILL